MQIGDVAARTGLSLRTLRFYEEAGLAEPTERSAGGFRLYSEADCARIDFIKRLKPLGFSVEEMRELMGLLEVVGLAGLDDRAHDRLMAFVETAEVQCRLLRSQLRDAEWMTAHLRSESRREHIGDDARVE
ncbi:MAG TPA: MerR family transcriptional regulator [Actinobacteria bacterium]|nr:MerR family transcriptional regulator [Actinomycetota bacterium]